MDELIFQRVNPLKEIRDEDMIRIMANENDELWGLNPKVDDETVKVAREFLRRNLDIAEKYIKGKERGGRICPNGDVGSIIISRFLGKNWYLHRVDRSLERLKLYEEKRLSRQAINILPTEGTARSFVKAVMDFWANYINEKLMANKKERPYLYPPFADMAGFWRSSGCRFKGR